MEHRVDETELEGPRGVGHPVVGERPREDQLDASAHADQTRQEVAAAPPGHEPEEDLRESQGGHVGGHRAVGAVEGELETSAERGAVDVGERRHRHLAEQAVGGLAELGDAPGVLHPGDGGGGRQVRTGRQVVRLPGDGDRGDLAGRSPGVLGDEHVVQLGQAGQAQGGGLRVVQAVVHGHQGERACVAGEGDVPDEGVGHSLGPGRLRGGPRRRRAHASSSEVVRAPAAVLGPRYPW